MKTIRAQLDDAGLRFRATSAGGHAVIADSAQGDAGPRPTELLLMALASCGGMDVISILRKKRQAVNHYGIVVNGFQSGDHPAVFELIEITHVVEGNVDDEALRRAVELSATRYCSIGATLSSGVTEIRHSYRLVTGDRVAEAAVCSTGPYEPVGRRGGALAAV